MPAVCIWLRSRSFPMRSPERTCWDVCDHARRPEPTRLRGVGVLWTRAEVEAIAHHTKEFVMAMPRKIPVEFGVAFPHGAYAVGEVQPVRDYDKSTRERLVQAVDPDTGLLLWSVEVVDGDPDA